MALTRKFLAALNIEEAQSEQIIEEHTTTVKNIKAELESYKENAEKYSEAQKQLEKVQKELEKLKAEQGNNEYKEKYDALKKEYDAYKQTVKDSEIKAQKTKAYKELLKESNISEKRLDAIIKLSDEAISKLEFEEDGSVKDKDSIVKKIGEEWSEFVQTTGTQGANTATPPANTGGSDKKISRAKQIAQQYREDLYGKIKEA